MGATNSQQDLISHNLHKITASLMPPTARTPTAPTHLNLLITFNLATMAPMLAMMTTPAPFTQLSLHLCDLTLGLPPHHLNLITIAPARGSNRMLLLPTNTMTNMVSTNNKVATIDLSLSGLKYCSAGSCYSWP